LHNPQKVVNALTDFIRTTTLPVAVVPQQNYGNVMTQSQSVRELIFQTFPGGTTLDDTESGSTDHASPPDFPPDLFAVTGVLLQRAGAYQHVISSEKMGVSDFPDKSVLVSETDRARIVKNGKDWSRGQTPDRVKKLWKKLVEEDGAVYENSPKAKGWWKTAFELMATADEASVGAGFYESKPSEMTWVALTANARLQGTAPTSVKSRHIKHFDNPCSLTSRLVNQDVVCVQPKSRTPDVGCSLRNISHNLSLLPPRGEMKVMWLTPPATGRVTKEKSSNLNLLLIPYPYNLENEWVHGKAVCDEPDDGWGWFDLEQRWLGLHSNKLIEFVDALITQAASSVGYVNGIVFPELALDYLTYEKLANHLRDNHESIQFLVSGSSTNCNEQTGNFALASHFYEVDGGGRMMATVSRPKHHRWSLENNQIKTYGLQSSFPPMESENVRWWEKIPLHSRSIHVNSLRSSSVFTAMICEDLARSDPAHEPLRAVGPNLVFVLLMDGPQEEWRWASRYSTGLAEDPGSSVLTITSMALIERWNRARPDEASWNIGIWKDEAGRAKTLECKPGSQAVSIQLAGKPEIERTVDGRKGREAYSWSLVGTPTQISLSVKHSALVDLFCGGARV
jgi:hypothetical protein